MSNIRPTARCIFRRNNEILLIDVNVPEIEDRQFFLPIGGGIEHGEHSSETMRREVAEEIEADIVDLRFISVMENIFTYGGEVGHEIVFVYEAGFADPDYYQREEIPVTELNGFKSVARWHDIEWLKSADVPTYPTGILDLL